MAVRVRTQWHRRRRAPSGRRGRRRKTLEDRAGVVGFNIWKIAHGAFKNMDKEGFRFGDAEQVLAVVVELVVFLVHAADRMVYGRLEEEERARFIRAVVRRLGEAVAENRAETAGPGEHAAWFVALFNRRARDYASFSYSASGPGYGFVRYLAERVSAAMAVTDNKWVVEHVMEIEAPEAVKVLKKVVSEVLGIEVN